MNGSEFKQKMMANFAKVIIGREEVWEHMLTALLAEGHVLLEDLPGTGKTKMVKTLAKTMDLSFSRIQFTPDLLPTDLTGMNVYSPKTGQFSLKTGPVFTNILLADEINRATPRTQAGLLECMEEHQVTIDGTSYLPGEPFFVVATQNPVETSGTFPLPEAQMDRFMMQLSVGSADKEQLVSILKNNETSDPLADLQPVLSAEELAQAKLACNQVRISQELMTYIAELVLETTKCEGVLAPVSPRGALALQGASKARAWLMGRAYVVPEDIKALTIPVLSHRLVLASSLGQTGKKQELIRQAVSHVAVPTEKM